MEIPITTVMWYEMSVILIGDKVIDAFNATVICLLHSKQKEMLNFIERLVKREI